MTSVLVTGATGFIGSALMRRLLSDGVFVLALVREGRELRGTLRHGAPGLLVVFDDGGVTSVADAMIRHKTSLVVHCAAHYVTNHTANDVTPLIQSNVLLGTRLAEAIVQAGSVPLIVLGTMWEHAGDPIAEYHPANLYAATKRALEDILLFYAESAGLTIGVLQIGDTYGPGDYRKKLIPALCRALDDGAPIDLSPGEQHLNLLHVEDVVTGILRAASWAASWPSGTFAKYALSATETVSLRELIATFERAMNRSLDVRWGARSYRPREVMRPQSPHPVLPGWQQRIALLEGLRSLRKEVSQ